MRKLLTIILALGLCSCGQMDVSAQSQGTFANPLLPSGADPYSFYKDGYYYYTHTTGNRLVLWKTKNIAELATAPKKTIWTPPVGTMYSKEIWAPEIHFIQGKWYMYFAADDGKNDNHRMYVLENEAEQPFDGQFVLKGKISELKKQNSKFKFEVENGDLNYPFGDSNAENVLILNNGTGVVGSPNMINQYNQNQLFNSLNPPLEVNAPPDRKLTISRIQNHVQTKQVDFRVSMKKSGKKSKRAMKKIDSLKGTILCG